jgi:hypothetical protein
MQEVDLLQRLRRGQVDYLRLEVIWHRTRGENGHGPEGVDGFMRYFVKERPLSFITEKSTFIFFCVWYWDLN